MASFQNTWVLHFIQRRSKPQAEKYSAIMRTDINILVSTFNLNPSKMISPTTTHSQERFCIYFHPSPIPPILLIQCFTLYNVESTSISRHTKMLSLVAGVSDGVKSWRLLKRRERLTSSEDIYLLLESKLLLDQMTDFIPLYLSPIFDPQK